jgi:hypothetical protein
MMQMVPLNYSLLTTLDTAMNYHSVETREWHADASGHYTDILKIKNGTDSSMGSLVYDKEEIH